ncbi:TA0938 family protein [Sulfolobus acidocaldarius]|uniref:Conserved Archaeal protein n=4 Tax=Sulfolobus acidocaldarius TaxID=2285 RepID=Q4J6Q4_SULAC|nr:TA0938 family protein [Sulfolobus acidocaldarius]AAY81528.1 conserved Archaeal protein [Sulfolobus acidocaldarius DSM 639]AGE72131.1 hypothetical protein SacN8_10925 [Sulfolobus acidocaldarius N8]AGE74448.1 hypothetical protein SacRon12I_11170 [Sulfolobus acidocaldarius Ron12/I]ALU29695.1 hypothetical protein ATY89_06895 [Sulfolobus acidocaldarius]ALU32430.1 hypothetical protein ATZ20_09915 [Sulfolobus acidocaldarius]
MKITVNGRTAGTKETGCALCGGTWGDYYEEIDGEKLFFCCDICALEFVNMLREVKKRTGWDRIDELVINGNYSSGRTCVSKRGGREYKFYVRFNEDAGVETFREVV